MPPPATATRTRSSQGLPEAPRRQSKACGWRKDLIESRGDLIGGDSRCGSTPERMAGETDPQAVRSAQKIRTESGFRYCLLVVANLAHNGQLITANTNRNNAHALICRRAVTGVMNGDLSDKRQLPMLTPVDVWDSQCQREIMWRATYNNLTFLHVTLNFETSLIANPKVANVGRNLHEWARPRDNSFKSYFVMS